MVIKGVQLELLRRIRLPGMRQADPLPAHEALDKVDTGRVQVRVAPGAPAVPVLDGQNLSDLGFFTGLQAATPQNPTLAAALTTLTMAGWKFTSDQGEVGAYGAYEALHDERHKQTGLKAENGPQKVELLDPKTLTDWHLATQLPGPEASVALQAGPEAARIVQESPNHAEAARRLRGAAHHLGAVALGDAVLGEIPHSHALDNHAKSAIAQARLLHPDDPLRAAHELSGLMSSENLAPAQRGLVSEAGRTDKLSALVARLWGHLSTDRSREIVLDQAVTQKDLKAAGRARIDGLSRAGYPLDAVTVGEVFCGEFEPEHGRHILDSASPGVRTAIYRQSLADNASAWEFWLGVMDRLGRDPQSGAVAAEAARQLDPQQPVARVAMKLNYRKGFHEESKLAVTRAALEHPADLNRAGVRALQLTNDVKDRNEIGYEFAQALKDSPSAQMALELAGEPDREEWKAALYQGAFAGHGSNAKFARAALDACPKNAQHELTGQLAEAFCQRDERLRGMLFFPTAEQLVQTLQHVEELGALVEAGPLGVLQDAPDAIKVNGVRLRKRG